MNNSKQTVLSIVGIAILVIAVVGVSFAFFTYSKNGTTNNFNNEHDRNMIVTNYNNNNRTSSKRKNIHSQRNTKNRNLYGNYGVNNANNINQIQNKNTLNVKVNDIEKNNIETYNLNNNLNYAINYKKSSLGFQDIQEEIKACLQKLQQK